MTALNFKDRIEIYLGAHLYIAKVMSLGKKMIHAKCALINNMKVILSVRTMGVTITK